MKSEKEITPILIRVQNHFGVRTRKEMMEKWGIPYSSYKTWVHRDNIPTSRLMELGEREGITLNWLETGTGEKNVAERAAV